MKYRYSVDDNGTYSYSVDDNGTLIIFKDNNMSIADISDCAKLSSVELETLVTEVLTDMGYEV